MLTITCPVCGKTSRNPNDVKHRYCGNCRKFHDQFSEVQRQAAPVITTAVRSRWIVLEQREDIQHGRSITVWKQQCEELPELTTVKMSTFGRGTSQHEQSWFYDGREYHTLHEACIAIWRDRVGAVQGAA